MKFINTLISFFVRIIKSYLVAGLATILPVFITVYVLVFVIRSADKLLGKHLNVYIHDLIGFTIPGIGLVFITILIIVVGYFSRFYLGKKLLPYLDKLSTRIPVVSRIYPPAKQFSDLVFSPEGRKRFSRVVLVPYPSTHSYAIGFVTNEGIREFDEKSGKELIGVLVPFGPTPFTGVLLFFPKELVIELDVDVDDAIKTIVSAGVISPEASSKRKQE